MPLVAVASFDHGLTDATSLKAGNAGARAFDNAVGAPGMAADSGRGGTGTRALDISTAASAERVEWGSGTFGASQNRIVTNFWIKFPSALPTTDAQIAKLGYGTPILDFKFRNSDDKLIVTDGTTSQAGPVVVADTWYHVEIYSKTSANPWVIKWWIDGVAQTDYSPAIAAQTLQWTFLGSDTNQSVTCNYDDWLLWTDTVDITGAPFGKHSVKLLKPDTGGTTAQIGTTDATARMVTNSAIDATHNSANILAALSEVPPLLGATATGVGQRTVGVGNAVGVPMTTYTLQSGETITGLRVSVVGWASAATANEIQLRTYNGTTETTLQGAVDPNFDNSTASPAWLCKMATLADFDTQSELDALVVRFGYSTDIAPLPGAHAIYAEVAVKESTGPASVNLTPVSVVVTSVAAAPSPIVTLTPVQVNVASVALFSSAIVALASVDVQVAPTAVAPIAVVAGNPPSVAPMFLFPENASQQLFGSTNQISSVELTPVNVVISASSLSVSMIVALTPVSAQLQAVAATATATASLVPVTVSVSSVVAAPSAIIALTTVSVSFTAVSVAPSPIVTLSPISIALTSVSAVPAAIIALAPATIAVSSTAVTTTPIIALTPVNVSLAGVATQLTAIVALTPSTINVAATALIAATTVQLTPVNVALTAILISPVSSVIVESYSPAVAPMFLFPENASQQLLGSTQVEASQVQITPVVINASVVAVVSATAAQLTPAISQLTSVSVAPSPIVTLAPAIVSTTAIALQLVRHVNLSATVVAITPTALAISTSVTLTSAVIVVQSQSLTVLTTVSLTTRTINVSPSAISPVAGSSVSLSPASISASARSFTLTPMIALTPTEIVISSRPLTTTANLNLAPIAVELIAVAFAVQIGVSRLRVIVGGVEALAEWSVMISEAEVPADMSVIEDGVEVQL